MIRYAYIIPFLPLASFFINIFFGKRLPRKGDWVCLGTIAAALVMSIGVFIEVFQAFDPNFKSMPLEAFEPMLGRVMSTPKRSIYMPSRAAE